MKTTQLRSIAPEHYADILLLNEAAIPAVNSIPETELDALVRQACYAKAAWLDARLVGFLIVLPPAADYQSLNYRWFSEQYQNFAYVDRIVVDPACAGQGIGRLFYRDLLEALGARFERVTAEVNIKPHNAASLAFHAALGFEEVGQQDTENGAKRVSLLARPLDHSSNLIEG